MPEAQTVSIDKIRADIVVAWRGLVILVYLPVVCLIPLVMPVVRDLPRVDLAPLRSPLAMLLVGLIVTGFFASRPSLAGLTAPGLWFVVIGSCLVVGGGFVYAVSMGVSDPTQLAQKAALLVVILIALYWTLLSPSMAALRLLATRVPPDGTRLPTVLASPLPQGHADGRVAAVKKTSPAAVAYRAAATALGIVGVLLWLWYLANNGRATAVASGRATAVALAQPLVPVLIVAWCFFVRVLWRRGRKLAAIDAQAALRSDSRRPILYLRSFRDDPLLMEGEWGLLVNRDGRVGHRGTRGPIARAFYRMATRLQATTGGGGRLEENVSRVVAPIGPFVALGAPGERLPELGAARAYTTDDTWQNEVIEWMDMAQLIVAVAGPTHSLRWEFDNILSRNAWAKLLILMPPSTANETTAAWNNLVAALQDRPWRDAVASLDQAEVVAIRLLEDGSLSVVTSCQRRMIDYVLAMRIMLSQMEDSVPLPPKA